MLATGLHVGASTAALLYLAKLASAVLQQFNCATRHAKLISPETPEPATCVATPVMVSRRKMVWLLMSVK